MEHTHKIEPIPQVLIERGFEPQEAYSFTSRWVARRMFREREDTLGLWIEVWSPNGIFAPIIVNVESADHEASAIVARSPDLDALLPAIDLLIQACEKAPFTE